METYSVTTNIESAKSILGIGQRVVSATWKQTQNQIKKERAIVIPLECLLAPEVPENFRALVESALASSAEDVLKAWVNSGNENNFQVPCELFTRPNLTESFLARGEAWMTKQELELAFTASATWKRITSRPEFQNNASYKRAAQSFKDTILKLSGKNVSMMPDVCDTILAKLEESDFSTEFGGFVVRRLQSLRDRQLEEFDLSAL